MSNKIISTILIIVGLVNLLPVAVFFDPAKTVRLYGLSVEGESLTILMRHRGVLLSLVGIALITAAFKPEYRLLAVTLALISKFAFVFLAYSATNNSAEIRQVALIDIGAIVLLGGVLAIHFSAK